MVVEVSRGRTSLSPRCLPAEIPPREGTRPTAPLPRPCRPAALTRRSEPRRGIMSLLLHATTITMKSWWIAAVVKNHLAEHLTTR